MSTLRNEPTPPAGGFRRFSRAAAEIGVKVEPVRYPRGTRTAADAAAAIACDVSQIVKSLILSTGDGFVLALTAGHHRVDLHKLGALVGRTVEMADAERVRAATGYAIGGTPPFGHIDSMPVYLDPALMSHDIVYGAAGTPDTCFPIASGTLLEVTGAVPADFVVG